MTLERMPGPMGPEPAPPGIGDAGGGAPAALRLQVLSTEHWGLLATRSLVWNESFARAGMFLTTLTGSIVALALIAQATAFGEDFATFALVVLAVVLFLGLATFARLGAANYHDAVCVVGMNRIRHAYLEIAPEVEPYLVMGTYDDEPSVNQSMGVRPNANPLVYIMASSPFVVATINSVLAGVIGVLIAQQLGVETAVAIVLTLAAAAFVFAMQIFAATRDIARTVASYTPKFPAPKSE